MKKLSIDDIVNATNGKILVDKSGATINDIVIDSRKASENNMFIAIIGESQDGHKYTD